MHRSTYTILGIALLVVGAFYVGGAQGQGAAAPETPHKVGLIDMALVFKDYKKFEALREDLKVDVQAIAEEEKRFAETVDGERKKLESGTFKQGSPEFIEKEQAVTKMLAEFQAMRATNQKELLRKESKIYHTIYMEVQDAVERFCKHYKYTLVMRFNREELTSTDPQKLMQGLNRPVIYHQAEDDLTDSVITFLNKSYGSSTGAKAPGASAAKPGKTATK